MFHQGVTFHRGILIQRAAWGPNGTKVSRELDFKPLGYYRTISHSSKGTSLSFDPKRDLTNHFSACFLAFLRAWGRFFFGPKAWRVSMSRLCETDEARLPWRRPLRKKQFLYVLMVTNLLDITRCFRIICHVAILG